MHERSARVLILCVVALLAAAARADMSTVSEPVAAEGSTGYSDEIFLELVGKYASDGGDEIDYAAWQASPEDLAALDRQIALIGLVSPVSHPEYFSTPATERRYWINAYNALVLDAVLEYWPLDSVRDVKLSLTSRLVPGKGFFHDRKVVVGGEATNLLKLEKDLLRSQKDPRLHFALNCGSDSCPVLRPSDWSEEELEHAARDFINDPENVAVEGETVYLSRIFKWYKKDFPRDIFEYLAQYAEPELQAALRSASERNYRKRYRDYDWSLNESSAFSHGQGERDGS
jgi:hypothetical protein